MTIDTQRLRRLARVLCIRTAVNGEMIEIQEAADQIDRLCAELEESSRALTLAGKTNKALMDQIQRDSKELRRLCADRDKWRAQAKHETLCAKAAAEEVERLREALCWNAAALNECCKDSIRESSHITINSDTKTFGEILDMADAVLGRAALQESSHD